MLTEMGYIDGMDVTIYGSTMDPMGYSQLINILVDDGQLLMGSMAHHIWQHHGSVMGNGLIVIGWSS